jgi:two-component system cell cycle response regulator CpdR
LRSLLKASKDYPDIPILLMTGYAAERQRAHNLDALIHDVISKLFTVTQICEMVGALPIQRRKTKLFTK